MAGWPRRSGVNVLSQLFYSFAPSGLIGTKESELGFPLA
jgi:hypothetical protein